MKHATDSITIQMITPTETRAAGEVLGRGMRDNPLYISALGENPAFREKAATGMSRAILGMEVAKKGRVLGALKEGRLVGVCGMMRPGCCQLSPAEKIALLPKLLVHCGFGTGRMLSWLGKWSKHDLKESHWHLGPIGIERELQVQGIGSLLMREFCRIVDAEKATSWLETDKDINVSFYRKHGFVVVAEDKVIGVPNWFMVRRSKAETNAQQPLPHIQQ